MAFLLSTFACSATLDVQGPFAPGETIPTKYTCDAENVSPALSWSAGPSGTISYALIVDDPDAPGKVWVHWLAWNLSSTSLAEGAHPPVEGKNDFKKNLKRGLAHFQCIAQFFQPTTQ